MAHRHSFEAFIRTLEDVWSRPFELIPIVFIIGGDLRQVLPVVPRGERARTVDACLTHSACWKLFHKMRLTINMRLLQGNPNPQHAQFAADLLAIGEGRAPQDNQGRIQFGYGHHQVLDTEALINSVYDNMPVDETSAPSYFAARAILCPKTHKPGS